MMRSVDSATTAGSKNASHGMTRVRRGYSCKYDDAARLAAVDSPLLIVRDGVRGLTSLLC